MKRPEEIVEWMRKQKIERIYAENIDEKDPLKGKYIKGQQGLLTIMGAFAWSETPQGNMFWKRVNEKFLKWYRK